jgi:hypothetical protein
VDQRLNARLATVRLHTGRAVGLEPSGRSSGTNGRPGSSETVSGVAAASDSGAIGDAENLLAEGNTDEVLSRLQAIAPTTPSIQVLMAEAYTLSQLPQRAYECRTRALELADAALKVDPDDRDALVARALALADLPISDELPVAVARAATAVPGDRRRRRGHATGLQPGPCGRVLLTGSESRPKPPAASVRPPGPALSRQSLTPMEGRQPRSW